ncbi:nucleotide sugar dehydrogenase [Afipia clevelandensis]|uniref:UDP-glucose 6-dehydrogenase n=1 Tax=Afipia clevelandensis ATCC 49720 TaxID=883079 RepID=K8NY87_9BRAD|nr:nucleotide sugar dehydrogenase [Afipia clevelandensis]EKS35267.1 nucleotide sugar dehydrogenase [Afipia clevelandensis ATCC 49720]
MKISVVGLGFVGTVTGACLCELGHEVVGVDLDPGKVNLFAQGRAPVLEPLIDDLLAEVWRTGRLRGTSDIARAVAETDLTFVCVGTLRNPDGTQDISAVETVVAKIGEAIAAKTAFHSVVIRSTVLPGTTRGRFLALLEHATGGLAGEAFGLANNPEFTREGSAVADFRNPSRIVIGEIDTRTGDRLASIYGGIQSRIFRTSAEVAETVKYADNSWHALKVVFANEMDALSRVANVDSREVMTIFCADTVLNISPAYLKPGFAFGGPCLPKDVDVLTQWCRSNGLDVPVLAHIAESNEHVIARVCSRILGTGASRIAFLGLAYKAGVGDLRGSPIATLAQRLFKAGCAVRAFDPDVSRGRRLATRHDYTDDALDGLEGLLADDVDELIAWAEMVVVTSRAGQYASALSKLDSSRVVIDLTGQRDVS